MPEETQYIAMVRVARDLADALRDYARERRPEDKMRVAHLQTELCAVRRAELVENASAP